MYQILQSKVEKYILGQLALNDHTISHIDEKLYISNLPMASKHNLEWIFWMKRVKCGLKEMILQVLKIYGVDVEYTDDLCYKTPLGICQKLECEIKSTHPISFYLNDILIGNELGDRFLLLLLYDPLKLITIMDLQSPQIISLFDTINYNIQQILHISIINYLSIWQLVTNGELVEDVVNIVISKYIQLLA